MTCSSTRARPRRSPAQAPTTRPSANSSLTLALQISGLVLLGVIGWALLTRPWEAVEPEVEILTPPPAEILVGPPVEPPAEDPVKPPEEPPELAVAVVEPPTNPGAGQGGKTTGPREPGGGNTTTIKDPGAGSPEVRSSRRRIPPSLW
jgi:hypothetical protein